MGDNARLREPSHPVEENGNACRLDDRTRLEDLQTGDETGKGGTFLDYRGLIAHASAQPLDQNGVFVAAPATTSTTLPDPAPSTVPTAPSQKRTTSAGQSFFARIRGSSQDVKPDSGRASPTPASPSSLKSDGARAASYNVPARPSITIHKSNGSPSKIKMGLRTKGRTSMLDEEAPASDATKGTKPFDLSDIPIPTGGLEDPFTADKVQFSNQGSVYMRGGKSTQNIQSNETLQEGEVLSVRSMEESSPKVDITRTTPRKAIGSPISVRSTSIQAPPSRADDAESIGGRPFSPDDRRLSKRVQSMYEIRMDVNEGHTDRAASVLTSRTEESPDGNILGALPQRLLPQRLSNRMVSEGSRSVSGLSNRSSIIREPNEAAGGVEDWTDVDYRDVDRYGFIRPRAIVPKRESVLSAPGSPHRPGSALPAIDETSAQTQSESVQGTNFYQPTTATISTSQRIQAPLRKRRSSAFDTFRSPKTRQRRLIAEALTMLDPMSASSSCHPTSVTSFSTRTILETKRILKWSKMGIPVPTTSSSLVGAGTTYTFNTIDPKLISRTWKGIPDRWRATAWHAFLTTSASRASPAGRPEPSDEALIASFHALQTLDCVDDMQIDMDVPRTIGRHVMFRRRYRGGQRLLFRVLRALALHFPSVGYVQGMAAVVATLLCYFDEEKAFVVACRIWVLRGVGWLYAGGFGNLVTALDELEGSEKWIMKVDGEGVGARLKELGVGATSWGTKWYLTLFNYTLPFESQLRVWDVFFLLGDGGFGSGAGIKKRPEMSMKKDGLEALPVHDFEAPNLNVLHAVSTALLLALRDSLLGPANKGGKKNMPGYGFEEAMEALTKIIPVRENGGEDVLMRVAKAVLEGI